MDCAVRLHRFELIIHEGQCNGKYTNFRNNSLTTLEVLKVLEGERFHNSSIISNHKDNDTNKTQKFKIFIESLKAFSCKSEENLT